MKPIQLFLLIILLISNFIYTFGTDGVENSMNPNDNISHSGHLDVTTYTDNSSPEHNLYENFGDKKTFSIPSSSSSPYMRTQYNMIQYNIDDELKTELNYPNVICSIRFDENTLNFDRSMLPNVHVTSVKLFTLCNQPLLFSFSTNDCRIYCYLFDKEKNKWINYGRKSNLGGDDKFIEDENGVSYCYSDGINFKIYLDKVSSSISIPIDPTTKPSNMDIEVTLLSPNLPSNDANGVDEVDSNLTIYIFPSNFNYTPKRKYAIFSFSIDQYIDSLKYPSSIDFMQFNGKTIKFDNKNLKLHPSPLKDINLFVCTSNHPFLLMFMTQNQRIYYYTLDENTKLWLNCALKYQDEAIAPRTDRAGNIYYTILAPSLINNVNEIIQEKCSGCYQGEYKIPEDPIIQISLNIRENLTQEEESLMQSENLEDELNKQRPNTSNMIKSTLILKPLKTMHSDGTTFTLCLYHTGLFDKFQYPNKINSMIFNDQLIRFDKAVLIHNPLSFIMLYTHLNKYPLIIIMVTVDRRYYYYARDTSSDKWKTYKLKYPSEKAVMIEEDDKTIYYIGALSGIIRDLEETKNMPRKATLKLPGNTSEIEPLKVNMTEFKESLDENSLDRNYKTGDEYNYTTIMLNVDSIGVSDVNENFLVYVYTIDDFIELKYPNKIDSIVFNGNSLVFDNGILYLDPIDEIHLYTSYNLYPLLITIMFDAYYYFYTLDNSTNKWKNYILRRQPSHLEILPAFDFNKNPYYNKFYNDNVELLFELDALLPKDLDRDMQSESIKDEKPHIEINIIEHTRQHSEDLCKRMRNEDTNFTKKSMFAFPSNEEEKYSETGYFYMISFIPPEEHSRFLTSPVKINTIRLEDQIAEFDETAILPFRRTTFIMLYTCFRGHILLIRLDAGIYSYFYALDSNKNKWTNYELKVPKGGEALTDINKVKYYRSKSILFEKELDIISKITCDSTCKSENPNRQSSVLIVNLKVNDDFYDIMHYPIRSLWRLALQFSKYLIFLIYVLIMIAALSACFLYKHFRRV